MLKKILVFSLLMVVSLSIGCGQSVNNTSSLSDFLLYCDDYVTPEIKQMALDRWNYNGCTMGRGTLTECGSFTGGGVCGWGPANCPANLSKQNCDSQIDPYTSQMGSCVWGCMNAQSQSACCYDPWWVPKS